MCIESKWRANACVYVYSFFGMLARQQLVNDVFHLSAQIGSICK